MARSNARRSPEFTARLAKASEEIRAAFVDALAKTSCKNSSAARGMGIDEDTVTNYVKGRTLVNTARVLAYPRLRRAFLDSLCGEHHEPVPASLPLILRAPRRKSHRGTK